MNKMSFPHAFKFVLALIAFVLFSTAAIPAQAKSAAVPAPCPKNCMTVSKIVLARAPSIGNPKVTATVTIATDASVDAVSMAGTLVYAKWTLPNGTTVPAFGTTNKDGQAVFQTNGTSGPFTFTIVNVVKSGFAFDRIHSTLSAVLR